MPVKRDCAFYESVNDMGALIKWCGHPDRLINYLDGHECNDCAAYVSRQEAAKILSELTKEYGEPRCL